MEGLFREDNGLGNWDLGAPLLMKIDTRGGPLVALMKMN